MLTTGGDNVADTCSYGVEASGGFMPLVLCQITAALAR